MIHIERDRSASKTPIFPGLTPRARRCVIELIGEFWINTRPVPFAETVHPIQGVEAEAFVAELEAVGKIVAIMKVGDEFAVRNPRPVLPGGLDWAYVRTHGKDCNSLW